MKSQVHPKSRSISGGAPARGRRVVPALIMSIVLVGCCIAPVLAGEKYMAGSPELSAALSGSNEFLPGKEVTLTVMVQNSGLNQMKFVQSGIISREDLPNTAKLLTVGLSSGSAPLLVKSDPQMVGDLKGGMSVPVTFQVKIGSDAQGGNYSLPLNLSYTYLKEAEQVGLDSIIYRYKTTEENLLIPVRIRPQIALSISDVKASSVNVGNEGYITMQVMNSGSEDGKDTIIKISRNGNSPVIPVDTSVYIGDFPRNGTVGVRYKVSVSRDAEAQTYPLDVAVTYKNSEGDTVTSDIQTLGVPVGGKIDFSVVSAPGTMAPGEKSVVEVMFRNTGAATAHSAQARISAVDPFTSNDDTAFLGDMAPGDEALARFEITADKAATLKDYGLDAEIRYRDALDNSQTSDTMKVRVNLAERTGLSALTANLIPIIILVVAVLGAGYYFLVIRKKNTG